jgi:hypothetical protein
MEKYIRHSLLLSEQKVLVFVLSYRFGSRLYRISNDT